ncbi:MAG: PadR family transcriptional regulator [Oscillospiraceae bacterium]
MNTQLRKGVIEMCILALIARRDMYGYEIVQSIAQHTDINEGTVYPILRRLTMESYFSTYLVESRGGPARKYYQITPVGRAYLAHCIDEWRETTRIVEHILGGEPSNDKA